MTHAAIPARLIVVVAERTHDTARWGVCPDTPADGDELARNHRAEQDGPRRKPGVLKPVTRVRHGWKGACSSCGEAIPWAGGEVLGSSGVTRIYDTDSGRPEPGDLFWVDHYSDHGCMYWDNCEGPHLHAILPGGHGWDVDSRAANCTLPNDRLHRCWVRRGEPPAVDVGKGGKTCSAGAGSIAVPGYHGFLQAGVFTAG